MAFVDDILVLVWTIWNRCRGRPIFSFDYMKYLLDMHISTIGHSPLTRRGSHYCLVCLFGAVLSPFTFLQDSSFLRCAKWDPHYSFQVTI